MNDPIMKINHLSKHFVVKTGVFAKKHVIKAVDDVSFEVYQGETLGLIGESGSGKTTLSNLLINLMTPDSGEVIFHGIEPSERHRDVQIVFQYTFGALDPLKTVEALIREPLILHKVPFEGTIEMEVKRLILQVGLSEEVLKRRPTEISGGQKQRVGIARALSTRPKLLILDEPVSALDVSVQGQIVNLLQRLKSEMGLTYLFITHDLRIARHLSDRLAVMVNGKIIEMGETEEMITNPKEAYTKALLSSL